MTGRKNGGRSNPLSPLGTLDYGPKPRKLQNRKETTCLKKEQGFMPTWNRGLRRSANGVSFDYANI